MKKITATWLFLICMHMVWAQDTKVVPIIWEMKYAPENIKKGKSVMVEFSAKIPDNHTIYSKDQPSKSVLPLTVSLDKGSESKATLVQTEEVGKRKVKYDDIFMADIAYFEHELVVKQIFKIKKNKAAIVGKIRYQVCNDELCLPGEFVFTLKR